MKGRTTCPKCKYEFVLDILDDEKKHEIFCPNCEHKFAIQARCSTPKNKDECSWEEHGEPRKTILSKIKPRTNKPMIATILLICVFAIGMTTAAFSESFIGSSLEIASGIGIKGNVEISVMDQQNNSINKVSVIINDVTHFTNKNGSIFFENVELGIQTIEISKDNYKTQKNEILVIPFFNSEQIVKMENGTGDGKNIRFDTTGCSFILVIFSVFALFGMIACLKRQHLDAAIAGSVIGIFSFGFFFIGSILSIIAFALIMMSRDEFENGKKGKIF